MTMKNLLNFIFEFIIVTSICISLSQGRILIQCEDGTYNVTEAGVLVRDGCNTLYQILVDKDEGIKSFNSQTFKGEALRKVEIFYNSIASIASDSFNQNMEHLDLSRNSITSIIEDFSAFPALTSFRFMYNAMTAFPTSMFPPQANEISFTKNTFTEIDVSNLTKLEKLYMSYNEITAVNLLNTPLLWKLDLNSNINIRYEDIGFDVHKNMSDLILNRIAMGHLRPGMFDDFPKLTNLNIERGYVTAIERGTFVNTPNLKTLLIANSKFAPLDCCTIPGLFEVKDQMKISGVCTSSQTNETLNLATQGVMYFADGGCKCDDYSIYNSYIDHCDDFSCADGSIDVVNETLTREGCQSIVLLNKAFTGMKYFQPDVFKDLLSLTSIDIGGNMIQTIPENSLSQAINTAKLYIRTNPLQSVGNEIFKLNKLTNLYLQHTSLTSFPPLPNYSLHQLSLEGNDFEGDHLHFENYTILRSLDLTLNSLDTFSVVNAPLLEKLTFLKNPGFNFYDSLILEGNEMKDLKLLILDLGGTNTTLDAGIFDSYPALTLLNLAQNPISEVPSQTFAQNTKLTSLDLTDSPLDCCRIPGVNEISGKVTVLGSCQNYDNNKTATFSYSDTFIVAECACDDGFYYDYNAKDCTECSAGPNCIVSGGCNNGNTVKYCEECAEGYYLDEALKVCYEETEVNVVAIAVSVAAVGTTCVLALLAFVYWKRRRNRNQSNHKLDDPGLIYGMTPQDWVMTQENPIKLETDEEYEESKRQKYENKSTYDDSGKKGNLLSDSFQDKNFIDISEQRPSDNPLSPYSALTDPNSHLGHSDSTYQSTCSRSRSSSGGTNSSIRPRKPPMRSSHSLIGKFSSDLMMTPELNYRDLDEDDNLKASDDNHKFVKDMSLQANSNDSNNNEVDPYQDLDDLLESTVVLDEKSHAEESTTNFDNIYKCKERRQAFGSSKRRKRASSM